MNKRSEKQSRTKPGQHDFHDLMRFKVSRILLVSSMYDAFMLEEDGLLGDQISGEYMELDLSSPPRILRVPSGRAALDELQHTQYDMIITMARLIDMTPLEFGTLAKKIQPGIPMILLLTDMGDIPIFHKPGNYEDFDKVFFWNGDSALFVAIIKYVEDAINIQYDVNTGMVRVILVIEDSPRYYSVFLPLIYIEIMKQTKALISEGLNDHERLLRKRARPKIILAETFEEGMSKFREYRDHILTIITDVGYPRNSARDEGAGFKLVKHIDEDIPILMQSSQRVHAKMAKNMRITFLDKNSKTLLKDLRDFFKTHLGFGDFVFKKAIGHEIGRAKDMLEFMDLVKTVPGDSLMYHGKKNHFSNWLMARGEFRLANELRPKKVSDFKGPEDIRKYLINFFKESLRLKQQGIITSFSKQDFEIEGTFTRLGGGSLGGKGRGLAFMASLFKQKNLEKIIKNCRVKIPDTLVIGTEAFDRFMNDNNMLEKLKQITLDRDVAKIFIRTALPKDIERALSTYLKHVNSPIAVRSSSLLEDSQNQPFAGIYSTYILPNNCRNHEKRLEQLCQAVKLVYASAFYRGARAYTRATVQSTEEEKMAVVIQKLVGKRYGDYFYPLLSGTGQSYNFYPVAPFEREDGIINVALGLGKIVVEGKSALSFSPSYPAILPGFSNPDEARKNSQSKFYALNMAEDCPDLLKGEGSSLVELGMMAAEGDDALDYVSSHFDANDGVLRDGFSRDAPTVITFAGILKYEMIPLASVIKIILEIGKEGMGGHVEMEFAGTIASDGIPEIYALQIRPLVTLKERTQVSIKKTDMKNSFICTESALGNGIIENISDIVYVVPETFDPSKTMDIASEIENINNDMRGRPYILIGPGRWGSRDKWLGIPVDWNQITGARAMVEYSLDNFRIDPSHGSHFFHNIISLGIFYLTVPFGSAEANIDWGWLKKQKEKSYTNFVRHVWVKKPLSLKIDGRTGRGIVSK